MGQGSEPFSTAGAVPDRPDARRAVTGGVVFELASAGKRFAAGRAMPFGPRRLQALAGVTLSGAAGERIALRGANGSGKSTLLRLLAGLLSPDEGEVRVLGRRPDRSRRVRANIGLCTADERSLLARLTVAENLRFFGALYGLAGRDLTDRLGALTAELGLSDQLERPAFALSSGNRAKLLIARALLPAPRLVLLDEGTHALDEEATAHLRASLLERAEAGACLVLATHSSEEAAAIATRTVELAAGRVVRDSATAAVGTRVEART